MNERDRELALKIAALRNKSHEGHASNTPMGNALHKAFIGVWGEMHFARCYGLPYSLANATQQVGGDNGIDFTIWINRCPITIDIKTTERDEPFLFVKEGDIQKCADILVLARYAKDLVTFLGWETADVMGRMPLAQFVTNGPVNYFRPPEELRSISQLTNLMALRDSARPM